MPKPALIIFDGECFFCNKSVQFIIQNDKKGHFKFTPQNSQTGLKLFKEYGISKQIADQTLVLFDYDKVYIQSTAVLRITKKLSFPWNCLYVFIIIPKPIRNYFYSLVAKYRHKIVKQQVCVANNPHYQHRLIE